MRKGVDVFPASAGVILCRFDDVNELWSFPRIRGGDPVIGQDSGNRKKFSPHPRG